MNNARAGLNDVRHAIVDVPCVNVVIGVVFGEPLVGVRVVPVLLLFLFSSHTRSRHFSRGILLHWRCSVHTPRR